MRAVFPLPGAALDKLVIMIFPALALSALEKNGVKTVFGRPLAKMEEAMLSDAAIEEKAALLLEAFKRGKK